MVWPRTRRARGFPLPVSTLACLPENRKNLAPPGKMEYNGSQYRRREAAGMQTAELREALAGIALREHAPMAAFTTLRLGGCR